MTHGDAAFCSDDVASELELAAITVAAALVRAATGRARAARATASRRGDAVRPRVIGACGQATAAVVAQARSATRLTRMAAALTGRRRLDPALIGSRDARRARISEAVGETARLTEMAARRTHRVRGVTRAIGTRRRARAALGDVAAVHLHVGWTTGLPESTAGAAAPARARPKLGAAAVTLADAHLVNATAAAVARSVRAAVIAWPATVSAARLTRSASHPPALAASTRARGTPSCIAGLTGGAACRTRAGPARPATARAGLTRTRTACAVLGAGAAANSGSRARAAADRVPTRATAAQHAPAAACRRARAPSRARRPNVSRGGTLATGAADGPRRSSDQHDELSQREERAFHSPSLEQIAYLAVIA